MIRWRNSAAALLLPAVAFGGTWSPDLKVDHFGYRPADPKVAILTASATGGVVEVRRAADGSLAYSIPSASVAGPFDDSAGDSGEGVVYRADFSDLTAPGDYYLQVPSWGATSYVFSIGVGAYNLAGAALLKAFFAQRCGTGHPASVMGAWADPPACHLQDGSCTHALVEPGTDYGALDLTGGWHDAGDHNKYIDARAGYNGDDGGGLWGITSGFELNATAFASDHTGIPESGNGVPDCLDEARWHLEWYAKMQRPDGSVLSLVHTSGGAGCPGVTVPSTDCVTRYYFDATTNSTCIAGACFARMARLLQPYNPGWAAGYETRANNAWTFVNLATSETKLWLAAELYRLNPAGANAAAAQGYVDGYLNWSNGAGAAAWAEAGNRDGKAYGIHLMRAMATTVATPGATAATVAGMKAQLGLLVDRSITLAGNYLTDMEGWEYVWGSNRAKGNRGQYLVIAARAGATGSHTVAETLAQAENYLHYIFGLNGENMVYASNMAALGGEHSAWRIYHGWFGRANDPVYYGKPAGVQEVAYPYYFGTDAGGISDNVTSTLGPFPGIVPGGPDSYYPEGGCQLAGANPPGFGPNHAPVAGTLAKHHMYRDFSYCCQGIDATGTVYCPWQVSENHLPYQGAVVALAAAFMVPDASVTLSLTGSGATVNRWSPFTYTIGATNTGTQTATNLTVWDTVPAGAQFVSATGGGVFNGTTVAWTRPALAPGVAVSYAYTVTITGAGPLLGPTAAAASFTDALGTPRSSLSPDATVVIVTGARLAATLSVRPLASPENTGFLVMLTVTNTGLADATGLDAAAFAQGGTGSAWPLAGPTPALPLGGPLVPAGAVVLTWTFAGSDLGTVEFTTTLTATDAATGLPMTAGPVTAPTATVYSVSGCSLLLNGCEAFGNNGTWTGGTATRAINTGLAAAISQGGASLEATITLPVGWNADIFVLTGFAPTVWSGYASLDFDLYVDPGAIPWNGGSAWHLVTLIGDAGAKTYQSLASTQVAITPGLNRVSLPLDWTGTILPSEALSRIRIVFNIDQPLGGDVYLDRMTLTTTIAGGGLVGTVAAIPSGAWPAPLAGQWFDLVLTATNPCTATVMSLLPDAGPVAGAALVTLEAGPLPSGPVSLPPGASQSFTWTYSANGSGTVPFSLTAVGVGDYGLPVVAAPQLTVAVPPPAALTAVLAAIINPVNRGSSVLVTLTVTNTGGTDATAVTPAALRATGPGALAGVTGPWPAAAAIAPGANQVFTWSGTASVAGIVVLSTTATGTDAGYGGGVTVVPAGLSLDISTSAFLDMAVALAPVTSSAGQNIDVRVTVTNTGVSVAVGLMPVLLNGSGPPLTPVFGPGPGPYTIGGGSTQVWVWTFTVGTPGVLDFSVTLTGLDATDGRALFASRTITGMAVGPAALTAGLTISATSAMAGQTRWLTVTVSNTGTAPANLGNPNVMLVAAGTGAVIVAGPPAGPVILPGMTGLAWTWTLSAVSAGLTTYTMTVAGTDANSLLPISAFAGTRPLRCDTIGLVALALNLSTVSATVDDVFSMSLLIQNTGSLTLPGVRPSAVAFGGDGAVLLVSGSTPAAVTLAPGAFVTFNWIWRASRAGQVALTVSAADAAGLGTAALTAGPVTIREPANSLDDMIVFPNPFRPAAAVGGTAKFRRMPGRAQVRIYTIAGELVTEFTADAYGYAEWDGRNLKGERVVPGVYVWYASAEIPGKKAGSRKGKLQIAP